MTASTADSTRQPAENRTPTDPFGLPGGPDDAERLIGGESDADPVDDNEPAEYLTGTHAAFRLGIDADEPILDHTDRITVDRVRGWCRRYFVETTRETVWSELAVVPVSAIADALDEIPTRADVAQDIDDQGDEDPHDVAARLIAERPTRLREKAAEKATKDAKPRLTDLMLSPVALGKIPPPVPLIEDILFRGTVAQLSGAPGDGKSFVVLSMACSLALGRRWGDHDVPEAQNVIYVAAEGSTGIHVRVAGWCEKNNVDIEDLEGKLYVLPQPVQLGKPAHIAAIEDAVRQLDAGLVVIDTRARCSDGVNENDATEQGPVITALQTMAESLGVSVLAIHHTAIGGSRGRGSGSWDGGVDTDLLLERTKSKKTAAREKKEGKAVYPIEIAITCLKQKYAEDGCAHVLYLNKHTVSSDLLSGATEKQRGTLVVSMDPFDGPDVARTVSYDRVLRYAVLVALYKQRPRSTAAVRRSVRDTARSVLVHHGVLEEGKHLPRGVFDDDPVDRLLNELAEDGELVVESANSTASSPKFELTDDGISQVSVLADELDVSVPE
ncbi:AAA family ATPase [Rhodococcus zopfii]|uniref:AAA family ATPase n=1 Tax=Rhodococcus zopfii TaxID=43772 RepID=UPI0036668A68